MSRESTSIVTDASLVLFQEEAASNKNMKVATTYYPHVHFFEKTGRWGAWVRCAETKKRLYLGTHKTKHLAARCQDRANLKLKNKRAVLNFSERDYDEDKEMRENLSNEAFLKFLRAESRNCYKRMGKSLCLQKFMAQEEVSDLDRVPSAQGRASKRPSVASKKRTPLSDIVMDITHEAGCPAIVNGQDALIQPSNEVSEKLNNDTFPNFANVPRRPRSTMISMATRKALAGRRVSHALPLPVPQTTPSRIRKPESIPERHTYTYYEAFKKKRYNLQVLVDAVAALDAMDAQFASVANVT